MSICLGGAQPHLAVIAVKLQVARAELHDEGRDQERKPRNACTYHRTPVSHLVSQKLQQVTNSQPQLAKPSARYEEAAERTHQ